MRYREMELVAICIAPSLVGRWLRGRAPRLPAKGGQWSLLHLVNVPQVVSLSRVQAIGTQGVCSRGVPRGPPQLMVIMGKVCSIRVP